MRFCDTDGVTLVPVSMWSINAKSRTMPSGPVESKPLAVKSYCRLKP